MSNFLRIGSSPCRHVVDGQWLLKEAGPKTSLNSTLEHPVPVMENTMSCSCGAGFLRVMRDYVEGLWPHRCLPWVQSLGECLATLDLLSPS